MNMSTMMTIVYKINLLIYKFSLAFMILTGTYLYAQSFQINSVEYSAQNVNVGCSIVSTPDSNLFIAGYVQNSIHNKDIYVLRLTKDLDTVWTKKIKCDYLNSDPTILYVRNNRLLVLGNYGCEGLLLMIDYDGKILWEKKIEYKKKCVSILSGILLKDKGFVLVGATYASNENRKAFITLTDTVGVPIWAKEFDLGENSNAKAISFSNSDKNSVIVGCNNSSDSFLLNVALNNGNLNWQKHIENNWIIKSMCVTPENNFLLVGDAEGSSQPDRASWNEGIIYKVGAMGDILWSKKNNFGSENSFCSIKNLKNNSSIIGGYKWNDMGIYNFTLTIYYNLCDSTESYTYSDSLFSIAKDVVNIEDEYYMTGSTFKYQVSNDEQRTKLYVVRFKLLSDN